MNKNEVEYETDLVEIIVDIEADALEPTVIHCIVTRDINSNNVTVYGPNQIREGCRALEQADLIIGHNVISYDIPALVKLGGLKLDRNRTRVFDTLVACRVIWPRDVITDRDFRKWEDCAKLKNLRAKLGSMDPDHPEYDTLNNRILVATEQVKLIGSHSLKAWGRRLGNAKGDFDGPWDVFTDIMLDYCIQDTNVTLDLFNLIRKQMWPATSLRLEHDVAWIIAEQTRTGFLFNQVKAAQLYAKLAAKREELRLELEQAFPPWQEVDKDFTPKVNNKSRGYVKGERIVTYKEVRFNPSSRQHIASRLKDKYGWEPIETTETGEAKVDETVLATLNYPEAIKLAEFFTVEKRIGQLAEGAQAWLKNLGPDGRIHGGVNSNGAVTGRMTHSNPNLAQVPSSSSLYGHECRELFCVPEGYVQVGADADALELRCLAGFMAKWDKGAYIKTVLEGDKKFGTDIHSVNCRALGKDPKSLFKAGGELTWRDVAKVWFYAFIYGAGDFKLGTILGIKGTKGVVVAAGRASRESFLRKLPALGALTKTVQSVLATRGYLLGLDGRKLYARGSHSALNTLLQSAGALIMKKALVIAYEEIQQRNLDARFVCNIHDEFQMEVIKDAGDVVGEILVRSLGLAGEFFNFPCPITGQYKVGATWAETH